MDNIWFVFSVYPQIVIFVFIGVSVSSGKSKIYWISLNAMFHWALLFTLTHGSTPSAHYIIYMSWCLDFGLFYETHLKEQ